jgi:hypothetical protein
MHFPILKFALIALVAVFCAGLTMYLNLSAGRDSWSDGRPALAAEFFGFAIGFSIFFWSFTVDGSILRWSLWGAAALVAIAGIVLSSFLSKSP